MVAGLALNLSFIPPYNTLAIADPWNAAVIVVFLLTGVAVATVVDRAARTTAQARRARAEADTLIALSRGLIQAGSSQVGLADERSRLTDERAQHAPFGRREVDGDAVAVGEAGVEVDDKRVCSHDATARGYVTKPLGMEELLARLRAALRRGNDQPDEQRRHAAARDLPHPQPAGRSPEPNRPRRVTTPGGPARGPRRRPLLSADRGGGQRRSAASGPGPDPRGRCSWHRLRGPPGGPQGTRSSRRQPRRAVELAEATRTRTALLAAVSHDLRSPLAAVKAAASCLASTDISWSAHGQARLLAAIEKGCHRLEHLIENLSNLSRLQMGAFNPFGRRGRTRRRRRLDPGPWTPSPAPSGSASTSPKLCPPALVDPGLLDRVIANVVENALRHTPPSSPITMRITPPTDPSARRLQVRAVDRGDGVPTARQRNLFVPVQRLADVPDGDGLGLGLAVARGMTEALGAG